MSDPEPPLNATGEIPPDKTATDSAHLSPAEARPLPPWDMYTVAVSLFSGYILIPLLISNVTMLINPFLDPASQLLVQQGVTLLTWFCIFMLLIAKYGPIRDYLGLTLPRPKSYYLWESLILLMLTSLITLLFSWLWAVLEQKLPHSGLSSELPYADYNVNELTILVFFAVIVAPVLEELIFRGLVQSTFHKISTPFRSVLFTCLVFLLLHGSYFNNIRALTHVLVLGLCFGIWRERTQSLVPSMVVHLLNNGLASLMLFQASQKGA